MDKNGVFLCSGCGIGEALDLDAVVGVADECGATVTLTHETLCDQAGLDAIKAAVSENELDGLLVCACSARAKKKEFASLGFDAAGMYRMSFREQCTWSHPANDEDTQMLAEDLVRMGMARMNGAKAIEPLTEEISDTVLVVGGGRTGMEAALAAAGLGQPVVLVERSDALGGRLALQKSMLPEEPPYDAPIENIIPELVDEVTGHDGIKVLTTTTIGDIKGQPGQFRVTLAGSGDLEMTVGAIVQATGSMPYDASKLEHLGYAASPDVVTSSELEEMLVAGKIAKPSDGAAPNRIVFIQCAGSRDPDHLKYCSSECCATTLRQVAEVAKASPDTEVAVIYRDIRTPGQMEYFFLGVQESAGMMMTRGDVEKVEVNGKLSIHLTNSLLGEQAMIEADLVVLAVGQVPTTADGELIRKLHDARDQAEHSESSKVREESAKLAEELALHEGTEILNLEYRLGPDLPSLAYSFPDSHFICFTFTHGASPIRRGRHGRGLEGRPVHRDGQTGRGGPPAIRRPRLPGLLPPALHAVQTLHRGVPLRHPQRGREGQSGVQPAQVPPMRHLHGRLSRENHQLPGLHGSHGRRDDQGHGGARGLRREAPHRGTHV